MELIKRDSVVVLMSTALGIFIITVLSFFIIWIGFPADTPQNSFKDALEFAGGLFGGLATFGAAIIAAHLFNDWRIQHDYTEKIKVLCEMLDVVNEVQDGIDEARNFSLISDLFLMKDLNKNVITNIDDQYGKYDKIKNSLHKLIKLENKIYLISNNNIKDPIFKDESDESAINQLFCAVDRLIIDASTFYEFISFGDDENISLRNLDFDDKHMYHLIMRLHRSGDLYLRIAYEGARSLISNVYTDEYEDCLRKIDLAIMNYRDALDNPYSRSC